MKPRPFILFCFSRFYPCGGMNDCHGFYDTVEEAKAAADARDDDYAEVWCHETMVMVAEGASSEDHLCRRAGEPMRWSE